MLLDGGDNPADVPRNRLGLDPHLDVVGAGEDDDRRRMEGQHVVGEADQHAAGRIAADPAIRGLHPGELATKIVAPALRDRVPEEHDGPAIAVVLVRPRLAAFLPAGDVTVVPSQGAFARQCILILDGGKRTAIGRRFSARRSRQCEQRNDGQHQ